VPPPDIVPLVGHHTLRTRLAQSVERGTLPASLLLHGPPGVGKQRLALWLAQRLLCTGGRQAGQSGKVEPCGKCQACRFSAVLQHPDLHWVFPRPRSKDPDASPADVRREYAEAVAERVGAQLLYRPADGSDAIYVATVRALVHDAALTPAMGTRKVIVVGNAERMVPQEGAEAAANAFLKMLEEPPADVTIILTSSASGALLPTIRSRVVALRVPRLPEQDVATWVPMGAVRAALDAARVDGTDEERVHLAAGAPGTLLGVAQSGLAAMTARAMVDAATRRQPALQYATALRQGSAGARGAFADALGGLTWVLHAQLRSAVDRDDVALARATCQAIADVEEAKARVEVNANPQLLTGRLLREMALAFEAPS
jgi:DNA polymerase III subunit delta'